MNTNTVYKISSKSRKVENNFFFLHGNGFPPEAYHTFLEKLSQSNDVLAMHQKPFSQTNIKPSSITGWDIFKNDAVEFLNKKNLQKPVAVGHSMGAVLILLIEIQNPGTFKSIFLLDPVITSKFKSFIYKILLKIKLIDRMHPMIQRTKTKKMNYNSAEDIFTSYRKKYIFSKIDDHNLKLYINSIIENKGSYVSIKPSRDWENAIYRNGSIHDLMIWKRLNSITIPTYIINPQNNEFGHFNYGRYLKNKNSNFINIDIEDATHLFPLEYPEKTARLIIERLN